MIIEAVTSIHHFVTAFFKMIKALHAPLYYWSVKTTDFIDQID